MLLGRVKVAINNLFMLMNKSVRHLKPNEHRQDAQDAQAKLHRIHVFIKDLDVMIREHRLEDSHNRREHRKQEQQKEQKEQQAGK